MGNGFNGAWKAITLNLENGATQRQLEHIIQRGGTASYYLFQEYTRGNLAFKVDGTNMILFSTSKGKKRLAIVMSKTEATRVEKHFTAEQYYIVVLLM